VPIDSSLSKSKGLSIVEYVLFAICLCVLALRTTLTEGPTVQSTTPINLADNIYTLSISAVLIFSFVVWFLCSFLGIWAVLILAFVFLMLAFILGFAYMVFLSFLPIWVIPLAFWPIFLFITWLVCKFFSPRFSYRFTGIEIGLCLFCVAAIVAGSAASNKRLAITNFVTLLAPAIMAILLVQILDSHSKIKLLLCVIAALAVVSAYQSAEQLLCSNQMTIDQYEQAPQTILEPLGIQPGTFAQFLFEHRLYTRGVRGFFTTSNSAGSFALLATFAAIALFIDKFKTYRPSKSASASNSKLSLLPCGIGLAIVIFALVITRSKGVIISSIFAAALFILLFRFSDWVKAHKQAIMIACFLLFIVAVFIVARYGLTYGRLPGGNSMLVRWQYWHASAEMYADHPLTGVGPGNFTNFYPRYKPSEALESVTDPHNFLLSILTQYGPLGLVGFLAMLFIPLWRTIPSLSIEHRVSSISTGHLTAEHQVPSIKPTFRTLAITYLIIVSAALLLIRPMIMRTTLGDTFEVMLYLILTLYVVPAAAFVIGFLLLTTEPKTPTKSYKSSSTYIQAALFCTVLGVMLHNLIDFAIFEPPVLTIFWAVIAALIATHLNQKQQPFITLKTGPFIKVIVLIITAAISWAFLNYCLIPSAASTTKIQRANHEVSNGFFERAFNLLSSTADDDKLDPTALSLNGRLYLHYYNDAVEKQPALLKQAEQCFLEAIARNPADFKNYERLSAVYDLLGQHQNAYDFGCKAAERYPGSAKIQFELAQIAEKLHKTDTAIAHYKNAIDIEDSFRKQFKLMYPNREIVSRFGQDKCNSAKDRLNFLSRQPAP